MKKGERSRSPVSIAQHAPFGQQGQGHQAEDGEQRKARHAQALALLPRQGRGTVGVENRRISAGGIITPELGFDDEDADQRPDDGDEEGRGRHEIIAGGGGDLVGGINELGRFLGDAGQQRIDRADQQVGGIAARDAGEGRRHPGEGAGPANSRRLRRGG